MKHKTKAGYFRMLVVAVLLPLTSQLNAQNVAITDDDGYNADPSAMLDVKSTTKGMLVPRLTLTERENIPLPATGLMVYQTDGAPGFYFFDGTVWKLIGEVPAESDPQVGANTTNYLSKWDGTALVTSSIFDNGKVGIGVANGTFPLEVRVPAVSGTQVNLKLTNMLGNGYNGGGSGVGLFFAPDDAAIAKMGIFVERRAAWGLSTMHFLSRTSSDYASAELSNSVMALTQNGYLGIGTTSPGQKLDVQGGNINTSGNVMTGGTARLDASGNLTSIGNITATGATTYTSGAGTTLKLQGGNSGSAMGGAVNLTAGTSGTNIAGANVSLNGGPGGWNGTGGQVTLTGGTGGQSGGTGAFITVNGGGPNYGPGGNLVLSSGLESPGNWWDVGHNGAVIMAINGTEYMRVDGDRDGYQGYVGIGTATPATILDVAGIITATGGNSTNWNAAYGWGNHVLAGYLTGFTETDTLIWKKNSNDIYFNSGNVGIGTTSPNAKLEVNGQVKITGGVPGTGKVLTSDGSGLASWETTTFAVTHYIGESYGGGIVFYVYDNGQHGLIAATEDQSVSAVWYNGTYRITGTSGDGLGAGEMNTALIVATQISDNQSGSFSAQICADYSLISGGVTYGDWYLPSKYELNLLYQQQSTVGGFGPVSYWSSSEGNDSEAWMQSFSTGMQYYNTKEIPTNIRAIRAF
ncbi:MAG: DUF1566 domain-containing protein [Bacteroidetes bacterium]|nr:DUF1566 domain-containing protein [Bacteroidota bacterium]